jgi:Protein of unknown function (DUF3253)
MDDDTPPDPHPITDTTIRDALLALLAARAGGASICPSDVARTLAGDAGPWRPLMPRVRNVARALVHEGQVQVTQRGSPLSAHAPWVGPIRIRRPR